MYLHVQQIIRSLRRCDLSFPLHMRRREELMRRTQAINMSPNNVASAPHHTTTSCTSSAPGLPQESIATETIHASIERSTRRYKTKMAPVEREDRQRNERKRAKRGRTRHSSPEPWESIETTARSLRKNSSQKRNNVPNYESTSNVHAKVECYHLNKYILKFSTCYTMLA